MDLHAFAPTYEEVLSDMYENPENLKAAAAENREAQRHGNIKDNFDRLFSMIETLDYGVNILAEKISPILKPVPTESSNVLQESMDTNGWSSLADTVNSAYNNLYRINRVVGSMADAVDL